MRNLAIVCCLCFVVVSSVLADQPKTKVELNWPRQIANDFLEAATSNYPSAAHGLLSAELGRALQADKKLLDTLSSHYSSPQITFEEVSPSGDEVRFGGFLKGNHELGWPDAEFRIRLTKEISRSWTIRFILIKFREDKK